MNQDKIHLINKIFNNETIRTVWDKEDEKYYISVAEYGNEFCEVWELQQILGYKEWRCFSAVIKKAQISCSQSNNNINSTPK